MKPEKELLGLDFDDCVAPFDLPFRTWVKSEIGVTLENPIEGKFAYSEAYPESGLTENDYIHLIGRFTMEASVDMMQPYPGVVEAVEAMHERFEVHIITARPKEHRPATRALIDKYIGNFVSELHMPNRGNEHHTANKGTVCAELGVVAMIDDADHNVNQVIDVTKGATKGILIKDEFHTHNGNDVHEDAIIIPSLMTVVRIDEFRQQEGRWPSQTEVGSL